jgi:cation transport regulator ChaB
MVLNRDEKDRLPSTLKRSPARAQEIYMHTLESAEADHGDGEAAHRIAFASLKHSFEKVGDHWEPKEEWGPSDDQDAKRGLAARESTTETAEGVNAYSSRVHLLDVAKILQIKGRYTMNKSELVQAVMKANRNATAQAKRSEVRAQD